MSVVGERRRESGAVARGDVPGVRPPAFAMRPRRGLPSVVVAAAAAVIVLAVVGSLACRPAASDYQPHDAALRALPLYFYPSADRERAPRAFVFFFGNDVGFWEAHQELAERLAGDDYAVVGFDVKRFLDGLPAGPAERDSAYAAAITTIVDRARHELGADSLPLVLGGHSIGAEIAIWTAAHAAPRGTVGVLALSPGSRSHLRVSLADVTNSAEPEEPGSFSVAGAIAATAPSVRVALVRGDGDQYRYADSALVAAAPSRVRRFGVPFAGHSLKRLVLVGPVIARAMHYLLDHPAADAAH